MRPRRVSSVVGAIVVAAAACSRAAPEPTGAVLGSSGAGTGSADGAADAAASLAPPATSAHTSGPATDARALTWTPPRDWEASNATPDELCLRPSQRRPDAGSGTQPTNDVELCASRLAVACEAEIALWAAGFDDAGTAPDAAPNGVRETTIAGRRGWRIDLSGDRGFDWQPPSRPRFVKKDAALVGALVPTDGSCFALRLDGSRRAVGAVRSVFEASLRSVRDAPPPRALVDGGAGRGGD